MVSSCLVEPLVKPLISGRGTGVSSARSRITRSRLAATALACSALLAVATNVDASDLVEKTPEQIQAERQIRNPHQKPAPIPYRELIQKQFAVRVEEMLRVEDPGFILLPDFIWDVLSTFRIRHSRNIVGAGGPSLGLARRIDALTGATDSAFRLFASGHLRSGASQPTFC